MSEGLCGAPPLPITSLRSRIGRPCWTTTHCLSFETTATTGVLAKGFEVQQARNYFGINGVLDHSVPNWYLFGYLWRSFQVTRAIRGVLTMLARSSHSSLGSGGNASGIFRDWRRQRGRIVGWRLFFMTRQNAASC
jgi:hypothetical protein